MGRLNGWRQPLLQTDPGGNVVKISHRSDVRAPFSRSYSLDGTDAPWKQVRRDLPALFFR